MQKHQLTLNAKRHQKGAALVVGLVLLVALTLLALASMNTASLDLIMTGNEQIRARVFAAAEVGIKTAYDTDPNFVSASQQSSSGTTDDGIPYTYTVSPVNCGYNYMPRPGSGNSLTQKEIHFTINSTATVARGTATNTQGVAYLIDDPGTFGDIGGCGAGGVL